MADKILGNNQVNIYGEVVSDFTFSHEVYGEGFYMVYLSVKRLSQVFDTIPLMISERLLDVTKDYRECIWKQAVSSAPITVTKKIITVLYSLFLFVMYVWMN